MHYTHSNPSGKPEPAQDYKYLEGVAYIGEDDTAYSEYFDETLYTRTEGKFQGLKYATVPYGTKPVAASSTGFSFSMRLPDPAPGNTLYTSNPDLEKAAKKLGVTTYKVTKKKMKAAKPYELSRGASFVYTGTLDIRDPNPKSKHASKPVNGKLGGTKKKEITFSAPASAAGRGSTSTAMGCSAFSHAVDNKKNLKKYFGMDPKKCRWEWLHLVGDAVGGATDASNLAAGTYDGNSAHNVVEKQIVILSQDCTGTDRLKYTVVATLMPGTAIAEKFVCSYQWIDRTPAKIITFPEVETLSTKVEDKLLHKLDEYEIDKMSV